MSQDRNVHFNQLKIAFPSTDVLKKTSSDTLFETAPRFTMPYCLYEVPFTDPAGTAAEGPAWDPKTSSLVECVRNAFVNMAAYWGPVAPPTMLSVAEQLSHETDRLLEDLVGNANCLDAYCYQLPIMKQMREVSMQTVNEVELLANVNLSLREEVESLCNEVKMLQSELHGQVSELQEANQNKLITSVCTPEALIQTLEADLRKLHEQSRENGKVALNAYGDNREAFHEAFEEYKATCKKMHEIDLKLRAYRSSKC